MIRFDCALTRSDFSLDAAFSAERGITALFGPSGSGKSTIIRLIAGLDRPDRGRIAFDDDVVLDTSSGVSTPPHRRRVGLVFQDAQLLPHLTVRSNLSYGLWFTPRRLRRIDFNAVVDVLGIGRLMKRNVASLSGGERQRVGIGRAILTSPRLLLMDEPLASLDAPRKLEILPFIERLRDEFGIPIIYVSHSAEEVARLADRVILLEQGRAIAVGRPGDVLSSQPLMAGRDRFSTLSVLSGTVSRTLAEHHATMVDHPAGAIVLPGKIGAPGQSVRVAVAATNVALATAPPGPISVRTALRGRVEAITPQALPFVLVSVRLEGGDALVASVSTMAVEDLALEVGAPVLALVKSASFGDGEFQPSPGVSR
jgi:molybdate transport system ATP-binding protein